MANLLRTAKSGSSWTRSELDAYNITIIEQDAPLFFETARLPQPSVPDDLLRSLELADAEQLDTCRTIAAMELAMRPHPSEESAVDDFAVRLFDLLGYTTRHISLRTRKDIPLLICGEYRHAKTDVCLLANGTDILLLVQEDKRSFEEHGSDPEAQLIAEAIASFQENNKIRRALKIAEQSEALIPGIVMIGSFPTFYKIRVTQELAKAVAHGTFPTERFIVYSHTPVLPRPRRRLSEGMKPLDNRKIILQCYEAFKKFIVE